MQGYNYNHVGSRKLWREKYSRQICQRICTYLSWRNDILSLLLTCADRTFDKLCGFAREDYSERDCFQDSCISTWLTQLLRSVLLILLNSHILSRVSIFAFSLLYMYREVLSSRFIIIYRTSAILIVPSRSFATPTGLHEASPITRDDLLRKR